MNAAQKILAMVLGDRARRLRYPTLLLLTGLVFLADVIIPDLLPFIDEIMLGLLTLLLASIRKRQSSGLTPT